MQDPASCCRSHDGQLEMKEEPASASAQRCFCSSSGSGWFCRVPTLQVPQQLPARPDLRGRNHLTAGVMGEECLALGLEGMGIRMDMQQSLTDVSGSVQKP